MAIVLLTECVVASRAIPSRERDVPIRAIVDIALPRVTSAIARLRGIAVVEVNRRRAIDVIAVRRAKHENALIRAIGVAEARAVPKRRNRENGNEVATERDANHETTAVETISPRPSKTPLRLDQIEGSY